MNKPIQSIDEGLQMLQFIQKEAFSELNGLFPSWRTHPFGYERRDNSAYFSATLLHSLIGLKNLLTPYERELLEEIRQLACRGVNPFQNKQGLQRYNFWKTNPGDHFPNGKLLGRWDYFRPPDDVDDSVMIYQMQKRGVDEAQWLRNHMDEYANGEKNWVKNCPPVYKNLQAYCTFFCLDMPLGFDACVISNLLYFNRFYQLKTTKADSESMEYLRIMLEKKDHIVRPEEVAPYYPKTSIILYHLAKLIAAFNPPELLPFVWEIRTQLQNLLPMSKPKAEQQLLENSWMLLFSENPPKFHWEDSGKQFYFFVLPLSLEFDGKVAKWLATKPWTHLRFHCQAQELAFEIENLVLKRQHQNPTIVKPN